MSSIFVAALVVCVAVTTPIWCSAQSEEVTKTISGVPYKLSTETSNPLRRIEFVTVTVDDMLLSSQFYGDVLGGMFIYYTVEA